MNYLYLNSFSHCMDLKILIPLFGPFITIFLGIITIPFIEKVKKRLERKRLLKALLAEMHDEIEIIDYAFSMLIELYKILYRIKKDGQYYPHFDVYPGEFKLYSIDRLLEDHFENLTYEIRHTVKHIKENIYYLNHLESQFTDSYKINSDEPIKIYENLFKLELLIGNYITILLRYRYNIRYLIDFLITKKSKLKIYRNVNTKDIIEHQLNEMNKIELIYLLEEYLFEKSFR